LYLLLLFREKETTPSLALRSSLRWNADGLWLCALTGDHV